MSAQEKYLHKVSQHAPFLAAGCLSAFSIFSGTAQRTLSAIAFCSAAQTPSANMA